MKHAIDRFRATSDPSQPRRGDSRYPGKASLFSLVLASVLIMPGTPEGQAATINVPPDPAPGSISSGTQLDLRVGGVLARDFVVGESGATTGAQLNIRGGHVDLFLKAYGTSTVSILPAGLDDGFLGDYAAFHDQSTLNIQDGIVGGTVAIKDGATVNQTGGLILPYFSLEDQSQMNYRGGVIYRGIDMTGDARIVIYGDEFTHNGQPVTGLGAIGSTVQINNFVSDLSGVLEDGRVFLFSDLYDNLQNITLVRSAIPTATQTVFNVPTDTAPMGLRRGQTLNLRGAGYTRNNFVAIDAALNITGGRVGDNLEVDNSVVIMSGGQVNDGFIMTNGSTTTLSGGALGDTIVSESDLIVSGGSTWEVKAIQNSTVSVSSGLVRELYLYGGASLQHTGGEVQDLIFESGSNAHLVGKTYRNITAAGWEPGDAARVIIENAVTTEEAGALAGGQLQVINSQVGSLIVQFHGAQITLTDSSVGGNASVGPDSTLLINNSTVAGKLFAGFNSVTTLRSGSIGADSKISSTSVVNVESGRVGNSLQMRGGTLNMTAGVIERGLYATYGTVNLQGGSIEEVMILGDNGLLNIFGTSLTSAGNDLASGMLPGESITFEGDDGLTDIELSGFLENGDAFSFIINPFGISPSADSTVIVLMDGGEVSFTLIPEPGTLLLAGAGLLVLLRKPFYRS